MVQIVQPFGAKKKKAAACCNFCPMEKCSNLKFARKELFLFTSVLMSYTSYSDLGPAGGTTIARCPFKNCHARIIPLGGLPKVKVQNSPDMTKLSQVEAETEEVADKPFYQIQDVWDFDNIGVSRPTSTLKEPIIISESDDKLDIAIERLLICSECDKGPIGFAGIPKGSDAHHQNLKYFLSCESVLYEEK